MHDTTAARSATIIPNDKRLQANETLNVVGEETAKE